MSPPGRRSGPLSGAAPSRDRRIAARKKSTSSAGHDARYQLLPPLTDDEHAALRADIAENGVLVPVVVDQHGHILDGHHRVAIAAELGINYRSDVATVEDDDHARRLARVYNLTRRHLTRKQRRELIADEIDAEPDRSDREIGRLLGVDHKTVGSVRRELRGEVPHIDADDEDEFSEANIAALLVEIIAARYHAAEDDEARRSWAVALQLTDELTAWGGGSVTHLFWFSMIVPRLWLAEVTADVWDLFALWAVPVAKLGLDEVEDVRTRRVADGWKFSGEDLARLVIAVWSSDADLATKMTMQDALRHRFTAAVVDAERLYGRQVAS